MYFTVVQVDNVAAISTPELPRVSVRHCWPSAPLPRGPRVLLSLQQTAPAPRPHLQPSSICLTCASLFVFSRLLDAPMILSCVDGAPPSMPDESITPACSTALLSAVSLFHFNQCWGFRKCFSYYLLGKE